MNIAVTYYSKTGSTQKLAEAIAAGAGCNARPIASFETDAPLDLLFIGGSLYRGDLDPALRQFISGLDAGKIRRAAVFCTYVGGESTGACNKANNIAKSLLKGRGIPVVDTGFACKGRFLVFNLKHPNRADLTAATAFGTDTAGQE